VSARPIRVLLADDHGLVRDMLGQRLGAESDLTVVAAVADAEQALAQARLLEPDVVVLDIDMPGLSAFDAAKAIRSVLPEVRILFLSAFFEDRYIEQALAVEASGYLAKTEAADSVLDAIRAACRGRTYFSPEVKARIVVDAAGARLAVGPQTRASLLTAREADILGYIARGMSKKEIARSLDISVKTVEQHTAHIMDKLDIHDRVELARYAFREGLASP
jgi:DNA-binding NarL/FixJ family response regulator